MDVHEAACCGPEAASEGRINKQPSLETSVKWILHNVGEKTAENRSQKAINAAEAKQIH